MFAFPGPLIRRRERNRETSEEQSPGGQRQHQSRKEAHGGQRSTGDSSGCVEDIPRMDFSPHRASSGSKTADPHTGPPTQNFQQMATLYGVEASVNCFGPWMLLKEGKIAHAWRSVKLMEGEQHSVSEFGIVFAPRPRSALSFALSGLGPFTVCRASCPSLSGKCGACAVALS
jgi:hypothetical protein